MPEEHPYQVPTAGQLIDWMDEGRMSTETYLDILEARFEEVPESLEPEDLWDLLRSKRISKRLYLNNERSWEDSVEDLPPEEEWSPVKEAHPDPRDQ